MARSPVSRTPLSTHAGTLRVSLLLSLGLWPLACGGTVLTASGGDGGTSAQAGSNAAEGGASNPAGGSALVQGGAGPTAGAGAGPARSCENPVVDPTTKLTSCANGLRHRAQATACTYTSPPPPSEGGASGEGGSSGDAGGGFTCTSNADCTELLRGYCEIGEIESSCRSGCLTDSDCDGGVCACNGLDPGRCTYAECHVDADCGKSGFCAPVPDTCAPETFHCITLQDECATNADCELDQVCRVENGRRVCIDGFVCGRPFLVEHAPRMAPIASRTDWLDATLTPNASELTPLERAELAAHWARLGQMEHASIAAFARFNLQLLSLAAPSHLVKACNRALADETAHARSCFALASAYGGSALGPSRLDIERCFEDTSLLAVAKLVLREGCLGETVAALEAVAAAEVARDVAVKLALNRIATDELSHAELAFQFLRWALSISTPEERHELACEAGQQLADFESAARNDERAHTDDRLASHGLLGSDTLQAIHLAAARDVCRPLLAALFDVREPSEV